MNASMRSVDSFGSNDTDQRRGRILHVARTPLQQLARHALAIICWSFFSLAAFSASAEMDDLHPSDLYGGVESLEFDVVINEEAVGPERKAQLERLSVWRYMHECLKASAYRRLLLPATTGEVPRPDVMPIMARKGPTNFVNILSALLRVRIEDSPTVGRSTPLTIVTYDVELVRTRSDGWGILAYQQPSAFLAADSEQAVLAQFNELCEEVARALATRLRTIGE